MNVRIRSLRLTDCTVACMSQFAANLNLDTLEEVSVTKNDFSHSGEEFLECALDRGAKNIQTLSLASQCGILMFLAPHVFPQSLRTLDLSAYKCENAKFILYVGIDKLPHLVDLRLPACFQSHRHTEWAAFMQELRVLHTLACMPTLERVDISSGVTLDNWEYIKVHVKFFAMTLPKDKNKCVFICGPPRTECLWPVVVVS